MSARGAVGNRIGTNRVCGNQHVVCCIPLVNNAWRLQGDVLLIGAELDTNVDPSSTMQVVNALIEANKDFDLLIIPGANHTSGGEYGQHKRMDFFVERMLGVRAPGWGEL